MSYVICAEVILAKEQPLGQTTCTVIMEEIRIESFKS